MSFKYPPYSSYFKALVAPRPIGWIATRNRAGQENLAPYSYFNAISDEPPMVMFSSSGEKDSVCFAREAGCFVANAVSAELFDAMNQSSASYPRGICEIDKLGLATVEARLIRAPVLRDAPAALECVVTDIIQPMGLAGVPSGNWMVLGQVVGVHIRDDLLTGEGRFDEAKAALLARGGYMNYLSAVGWFAKPRPADP